MRVRPATAADAARMAEIERLAAHVPWSRFAVATALAQPATVALVCGEPVAGHVLATAAADEGEVLTLAVHPDLRRRGIGRHLLVALGEAWRDRGVRTGWLEVRTDNVPALNLYRASGWTLAGRRRRYYADGTDAEILCWEVP